MRSIYLALALSLFLLWDWPQPWGSAWANDYDMFLEVHWSVAATEKPDPAEGEVVGAFRESISNDYDFLQEEHYLEPWERGVALLGR